MRFEPRQPPRRFQVRPDGPTLTDCGDLRLAPGEQITLVTSAGRRWDVAAKEWGFYATPSLNDRLKKEGLRAALAVNAAGRRYLLLVEADRVAEFQTYLAGEAMRVEAWLDEDSTTGGMT